MNALKPLAGYPWKPWVVLFHLHVSAKAGISLCEQDTHLLTFSLSQVLCCSSSDPASYFSRPSQISPLCPLKTSFHSKLPLTYNLFRFLLFSSLSWNLIHSQRCHFSFFSFALRKDVSFFYLLSRWNLQMKLASSLYKEVFPNHHFCTFSASGFHWENQNFLWSDPCSYTEGPLGSVNCIKLDGAYMVGYSILCIFHRYKVFFNKYLVTWVIHLGLPMPVPHVLSTKSWSVPIAFEN